jgi:NADPH:quinone reductase-like Zn-dependent oxidoreductase
MASKNYRLSLFDLRGRTAIVSGAASGIGLAAAEILAEAGANVAILYHNNAEGAFKSVEKVSLIYGVKCHYHLLPPFSEEREKLTISRQIIHASISS